MLLVATLPFAIALLPLEAQQLHAQTVDLVVNIVSDQPAYMAFDEQFFTVTISNNGPDVATNVTLVVEHPVADLPFEMSATCLPVAGPDPNGPAMCPPGSSSPGSAAFVRNGQTFSVTLPQIPSQSQARIDFSTRTRCPEARPGGEGNPGPTLECIGVPSGNFPVSAVVDSDQTETNAQTNTSFTNVFLFPPDVQYKVEIVSAPASATPGSVVDYVFEVTSFGLQPSDRLSFSATITGEAGTMVPLNPTNNPFGANGSTLPNTQLQGIDCLSATPGTDFPVPPAAWQTCPSIGVIPIPVPTSPSNFSPITGFPPGNFLDNLPGTLVAPPGGGVIRFVAHVLVGDPVCVATPDSGVRDLVFRVGVSGLNGTDLVAPGPADNTASAVTTVAGNCQEADIEFTTRAIPATFSLDGSGNASWVHEVTVSNVSPLGSGTATNVPVEFSHSHVAFSETLGSMSCSSTPAGLCPSASQLAAGVVSSTPTYFKFAGTLASIPPGASVTFTQAVTISRTTCWNIDSALIDLRGTAAPSPALFDPIYSATTPPQPPPFTPGSNSFFGNNGMQTIADVRGLLPCPGGGGSPTEIELVKSGPFASVADANAGAPLIGQTPATFVADATQVFYKIVVANPNTVNPVLLGSISDSNFFIPTGLAPSPPSGFIAGLPSCVASPSSASCHELVSTSQVGGYHWSFSLGYDPTLHGGDSEVALAPLASLTYIVPFTMPTHLNKCHAPQLTSNSAWAAFRNAANEVVATPLSIAQQYIGMPPCVPGQLEINKDILPPATSTSIPLNGEISFGVTLTNTSTATLDIARFVDSTSAPGVTASVVSIACTSISGGAQCPTNPVIPGMQTPASGPSVPLANPLAIDHEWGSIGNNTFPPGGSIQFIITLLLENPSSQFGCVFNNVAFTGLNDPNGWIPDTDSAFSCPPPGPRLSLQKQVSPQIAAPGSLVTYTVIVTNISGGAANGAVFIDSLPPALLADNPNGYSNVSCTDISGSSFIPNPQGTAVCPTVVSNASGLSATIATFGANTALQFTYQAVMPATVVSIDNLATIAPSALSFGTGTAQSRQNVQVIAAPDGFEPEPLRVPALRVWALSLLALLLMILGAWEFQQRRRIER